MALKRIVAMKCISIHILAFSSLYLSDVRHHNHPLLRPNVFASNSNGISPFFASQRVPASDPYELMHALRRRKRKRRKYL
jgi:hypothetical protein